MNLRALEQEVEYLRSKYLSLSNVYRDDEKYLAILKHFIPDFDKYEDEAFELINKKGSLLKALKSFHKDKSVIINESDLHKCPFCKSTQILDWSRGKVKYIQCMDCNAKGPVDNTVMGARRLWNGIK